MEEEMEMRVEFVRVDKAGHAKPGMALAAVFNEGELMVVLFEAITVQRRPADHSWQMAAEEIEERFPEQADACRRAARAAMQYFAAQVAAAGRTDQDVTQ